MKRKLIAVGAAIGVPVLFGLAFAFIGLSTAAAAMFSVALLVPFGIVCTALFVGGFGVWRRCQLAGRVALIVGILLAITIWLPQGAFTLAALLLSIFTLIACAVASAVGARLRADGTP